MFASYLYRKNATHLLPRIEREYKKIESEKNGVSVARIEAPNSETATEAVAKLGSRFQPEIIIDPSLVGGVRISVGSQRFDGSVKRRLEEI